MGIAQYKNAATTLRTRSINTTHKHFSNEVYNFDLSQGAQKILVKVEM